MAPALQNAATFLESGELADFALKCEDYEWKVHRLILASGSNVFQKACAGDFKVRVSNLERENATKEVDLALPHKQLPSIVEATARVIELHDDEPEMVARMLLCLYTSDYPLNAHQKPKSGSQSVVQLIEQGRGGSSGFNYVFEINRYLVVSKMFVLADKYGMSGLKELCVAKLETTKPTPELPEPANLQKFLESLEHIYNSTPPTCSSLRMKATGLVQKRYRDIITDPTAKSKLRDACLANAHLAWDLFSTLFSARDLLCRSCDIWLRVPQDLADPFDLSEWCRGSGEVCLCGLTQVCGSKVCFTQIKKNVRCPGCVATKDVKLVDIEKLDEQGKLRRMDLSMTETIPDTPA